MDLRAEISIIAYPKDPQTWKTKVGESLKRNKTNQEPVRIGISLTSEVFL